MADSVAYFSTPQDGVISAMTGSADRQLRDEPRFDVSHASSFRRPGLGERLAAAVGQCIPPGLTRRALRRVFYAVWRCLATASVVRLPHGETVRLRPEHRHQTWNPAEYEAFRARVKSGDVVLDVGANIGAYSLLFGQWVGPDGKVFAFEPSPGAAEALEDHIAMNRLAGIVMPVRAAVAETAGGTAGFSTHSSIGLHRLSGPADQADLQVPVETLDAFCRCRGLRPACIKIDVEGAELSVLRGGRETLARVGRGLEVFVEFHPSIWSAIGIGRADLERELAAQGLQPEPLKPGEPVWTMEGVCVRLRRS